MPRFKIPKSEDEMIKVFIGASLFVHFFFLVFGMSLFSSSPKTPIVDEWEIEADLVVGVQGDGKFDAIKGAAKGDEIKVNKQILPQLTKNFEIEQEKEKHEDADLGETIADPSYEKEERKKRAAAKLKKLEALKRLLKEKARKDKKFADKTTSPVAKRLQARKRELEGKDFSLGSDKKVNGFLKKIEVSIKRYYSLPEVYRFSDSKLSAVISVKVGASGQILDISISKSSGNSGFDEIGMSTIRKAAPLPVPPKELIGKAIAVNFDPS